MKSYKLWILDFCGAENWKKVLQGLGIVTVGGVLADVPKFTWTGPDIELTTYSNPITGEYQHGVLPDGFGPVCYIGIKGSDEKADLAASLIKQHTKIVPA